MQPFLFIYCECYSEPTLYSDSEFGEGKGPIVLSNVECGGWETDIFQCSSMEYLTFSCPRNHTAGVLCRDCEYTCHALLTIPLSESSWHER